MAELDAETHVWASLAMAEAARRRAARAQMRQDLCRRRAHGPVERQYARRARRSADGRSRAATSDFPAR